MTKVTSVRRQFVKLEILLDNSTGIIQNNLDKAKTLERLVPVHKKNKAIGYTMEK